MNKILLIGCGYWGKNWYKTIKKSKNLLVGVVDPSPVVSVDTPLFTDISKVDVEYTHVILAVNAKLHTNIVNQLEVPHENILVEKPCGISYNDAKQIKDVFPGYIFLYSNEFQYIKNNLNLLGQLQFWRSTRASMGPRIRSDVSIIEDYLIHDLYIYLDLFGEYKVINKQVRCEFSPPINNSSIDLTLENRIRGHFYSSWNYPIRERKIIIKGSEGSFIWDNDDLFFNSSKYLPIKGVDTHGNVGYNLIDGEMRKIPTSNKSNLEIELSKFMSNDKPSINVLDVWRSLQKI